MDTADVLQRFAGLPFTVEAEIASLSLTIGEILTLQEGAVLRTDHPAGAPFILSAGGAEIAEAEAVVVGDSLSMRVKNLSQKIKPEPGADGTH
jgi:flagellar motor switch/type III secretory pathway protein FliN